MRAARSKCAVMTARPRAAGSEQQLAHFAARQAGAELDGARVLVRRHGLLDEVLQCLDHRRPGFMARMQHHEGLDDLPALRVRHADHAALGHGRVQQQRILHLGRGDVVARRDDHVVGARVIVEVALFVHHVGASPVRFQPCCT